MVLGQLFRCTLLISIKTVCFDEQVTRNGYESSRQQVAALQHCDSISFSWNVYEHVCLKALLQY